MACRHTEFRVFKAGDNETAKGIFRLADTSWVDREKMLAVSIGGDLSDRARPVFGFARLEVRDGDLWAVDFSWSEAGKAYASEHPEFSIVPTVMFDEATREILRVLDLFIVQDHEAGQVRYVVGLMAGDVVRRKSGGPAMTVNGVVDGGARARCKWFDAWNLREETIAVAELKCARAPIGIDALTTTPAGEAVLKKAASVFDGARWTRGESPAGPILGIAGERGGEAYEVSYVVDDNMDDLGPSHLLGLFTSALNQFLARRPAGSS